MPAMDWATYQQLCDSPRYWSRWMLVQCAALLQAQGEPAIAGRLRAALEGESLAKPADHRGPPATDMFALALAAVDAQRARAVIAAAADAGLRTPEGRGLGGFVAAWDEYLRHLGQGADR
jgi:hypothetical protein